MRRLVALFLLGACGAPAPAPSEPPPWVSQAISKGWKPGQWLAISGSNPTNGYGLTPTNTLASVNTAGDSAQDLTHHFITSWTGAALCIGHRSYGTYMMGPGGNHNNYDKGTTYLFDLETREWEEVAGEDTSGFDPSSPYGEYNSGRPVTNHSAWWPFYDSYRNEFAYPRGWGSPISGSDQYPKPYGHGLDLASYDTKGYSDKLWRRYPKLDGLTADELNGLCVQCGGAWDESRNSFWLVAAHNSLSASGIVARYSSVDNAWTLYEKQWCVFLGSAYAIDPIRDVLTMPGSYQNGRIYCLSLSKPNERYQEPRSTSALWVAQESGARPENYGQIGWHWSKARNGFIYYDWHSPATVRLASYVSGGTFKAGQQTDYRLEWSVITSPDNSVVPTAKPSAGGNVYSKFQLARWGSVEIAFFYPRADGAMYAFRVS